jgi:hypothetical protein
VGIYKDCLDSQDTNGGFEIENLQLNESFVYHENQPFWRMEKKRKNGGLDLRPV